MGWKSVKDHYRIGHIVSVNRQGICIGSPYISAIIVIDMNGVVSKRYEKDGINADLERYQQEFDADPTKLAELVAAQDHFSASLPVYSYDGATIVEDFCESYGWPNVTHKGALMYENTHSADRALVVEWAKESARSELRSYGRRIEEIKTQLEEKRSLMRSAYDNLLALSKAGGDLPAEILEFSQQIDVANI